MPVDDTTRPAFQFTTASQDPIPSGAPSARYAPGARLTPGEGRFGFGAPMADDIVVLIIGFVLTTVLGSFLGYMFQRRSWSHQFNMTRVNSERESAAKALDELADILDKRRYRMLLVFWFLDSADDEEFERRMAAYRAVLLEWNDGLNRRLALVATHFGAGLKQELADLYEAYRRAGQLLDVAVRERRGATPPSDRTPLIDLLESLNLRNYGFAETGLSLIVADQIGSRMAAPQRRAPATTPVADV